MHRKIKSEYVCPRCGRTYTERCATARDSSGPICSDCRMWEALGRVGVGAAEQERILDTFHRRYA